MRNEGGRCGEVRRLLDSSRGAVARIAPCLMARCGGEATALDAWRDRPAPHRSPIGRRAQSAHLSRFASPWVEADLAARAPRRHRSMMNDVPPGEVVERAALPRGFARIRVEHLEITCDMPSGRLTAMEDISFNIEGGEILCRVGASGCGKSSLLNALGGFVAPAQDCIEVEGCEVGWAGLRRRVLFQEYALFSWLTARRNIEFGLQVRGLSVATRRNIAQRALEQLGLSDFVEFYPHRLSGGMRQRVAVALALAFDPDLMLMDEPFAALDEEMREELQGLVIKLWHETQKTFVYVIQSVYEAGYLADRVIVLTRNPTRIREVITVDLPRPHDRLSDEFHAYVKALVRFIRRHN
jgi:NitT/TauT family transport system ATP-binding protein